MLETLWESRSSKPPSANQPALKLARAAKSDRTTRLQLEELEDREVPSVSAPTAVADTGDVMQASQISAFYQQSALVSRGQPTSDPTVSWGAPKQDRQSEQMQITSQMAMRMPGLTATDIEGFRPAGAKLQLLPGHIPLGRLSGGMLRLAPSETAWPPRVFAPYVDLGVWPTFDLVHAAETQGVRYFNLASVTADAHGRPSWCGHEQYAIDGGAFDMALRRQIAELRNLGGDVAASFGGSQGTDLAQAIGNVDELKNAYREVVDAYQLRRIDFAIDVTALNDPASIDRRSRAVGQLQREMLDSGRTLEVWFTLPGTRAGLSEEGTAVIHSALVHGVQVGGVNIKMVSGQDDPEVKPEGKMGVHAVEATINLFQQLQKSLGRNQSATQIWSKIGVTPTIGQTAAGDEKFDQKDARAVLDFARQQGVGMIGMWSINRDQQSVTEPESAGASASGVEQEPFEFSDIFAPFTRAEGQ